MPFGAWKAMHKGNTMCTVRAGRMVKTTDMSQVQVDARHVQEEVLWLIKHESCRLLFKHSLKYRSVLQQ